MNATEFTINVRPADELQPASAGESPDLLPPAPVRRRDPRLRYALLAGVALLAAWLAFTVRHSISEIEAEVDMIRANILAAH